MAGWTPIAPWKLVAGSGQTLSVTTSSATFTNKVGLNGNLTQAIALSLAPTATATGALFTVTHAGTAATTSTDYFIKTTDPPQIIGCAPGDKVSAIGLASCTAYLCELTH